MAVQMNRAKVQLHRVGACSRNRCSADGLGRDADDASRRGDGRPGGSAGKDGEREQTQLAAGSEQSDLMHGRHAQAEAVPWGTIARNDGKRSGPQPDAA